MKKILGRANKSTSFYSLTEVLIIFNFSKKGSLLIRIFYEQIYYLQYLYVLKVLYGSLIFIQCFSHFPFRFSTCFGNSFDINLILSYQP